MLRIRVRAPVKVTEDPEKVRRAILNLFPDAILQVEPDRIEGSAGGLGRLAELVRKHQIPDTARNVLLRGRRGETTRTRVLLGKQAAFVARPNLGVEPGPLGEIEVEIEADEEKELLYAIYEVGFDTTVPDEWAKVPREFRPDEVPKIPGGTPATVTEDE